MSNYITLNRKKHISVLADHRIDPVTKELLKVRSYVQNSYILSSVAESRLVQ